jgi:hypothetical protein
MMEWLFEVRTWSIVDFVDVVAVEEVTEHLSCVIAAAGREMLEWEPKCGPVGALDCDAESRG